MFIEGTAPQGARQYVNRGVELGVDRATRVGPPPGPGMVAPPPAAPAAPVVPPKPPVIGAQPSPQMIQRIGSMDKTRGLSPEALKRFGPQPRPGMVKP
jgi:hypothetical protein